MRQTATEPIPKPQSTQLKTSEDTSYGLLIACLILSIWATSIVFLVSLDVDNLPIYLIIPAMIWQMFIYTGLFITVHEAIHGILFPRSRKINNLVGSIAALIYALFSFQQLSKKHWQHHNHPASELDPDFSRGKNQNFWVWYWQFTKQYWSWTRLLGLMAIFNLITHTLHIPDVNLTLFWVIPSVLSSVQLFYFGNFLPHKEPKGGYINPHRAKTNPLPVFWSFITCYHFGYHQEHHEYPCVPWWRLPGVYKINKSIS